MKMDIHQPATTARFDALIEDAIFSAPANHAYRGGIKRIVDVLIVLAAALPVLAVLLILAPMIALDGKSPFYMQKRVGKNGRIFGMLKLRSMVSNADEQLQRHLAKNPEARAEWDRNQKLRHDPRITRVGRVIRKTSIDELPQLWNVLTGDMSIVGPRPMMVNQQDLYPGTAYYALRPGITGFWQTSVRNESSFADRAGYDADYLRQLSLTTDLKVIMRTFKVVLNGTGC